MRTQGYVGTIEVETEGTDRAWFSLTTADSSASWVVIDKIRAWFQIEMEESDKYPVKLAKIALLLDAMREGYQVEISHGGTARSDISRMTNNDTYDAVSIRALRTGIHF